LACFLASLAAWRSNFLASLAAAFCCFGVSVGGGGGDGGCSSSPSSCESSSDGGGGGHTPFALYVSSASGAMSISSPESSGGGGGGGKLMLIINWGCINFSLPKRANFIIVPGVVCEKIEIFLKKCAVAVCCVCND